MQAYPTKDSCYAVEKDFKFKEDFKVSKDEYHHNKGLTMHMNKPSNYNKCEEDFKFKEEFKSSMHMKPNHQNYNHMHGHGHHDGGYGHGHHDGYGSQSESWTIEKEECQDGYSSHGGGYGGYGGMGRKKGGGGYGVEEHEYHYYSEQRKGLPVWNLRNIND